MANDNTSQTVNVFPALDTINEASWMVENAILFVNQALDSMEDDRRSGSIYVHVLRVLEKTRSWIRRRIFWIRVRQVFSRKPVDITPVSLNKVFYNLLRRNVPQENLLMVSRHLLKLMAALHDNWVILEDSRQVGSFPKYGDAIHQLIQKIHNASFEWGMFEFRGKRLVTSATSELYFLKASQTTPVINTNDTIIEIFKDKAWVDHFSVYFVKGAPNHFLHLQHLESDTKISSDHLDRLYFGDQFGYYAYGNEGGKQAFSLEPAAYVRILQSLFVDFILFSDDVQQVFVQKQE